MKMPMLRMSSTFRAGVDEAGDGAEDHAGDGVCEDGVQAEALEDALEELGGDDEHANGKESFVDLHPVVLPSSFGQRAWPSAGRRRGLSSNAQRRRC